MPEQPSQPGRRGPLPDVGRERYSRRLSQFAETGPIARIVDAVAQVTGETDLESVLERIVGTACSLVGARYGALGILDTSGELHGLVFHGVDADSCPIEEHPHGKGLLRLLIDDPRPIRMARMSEHPASFGLPGGHRPMESFLGVPIQGRGRVFGNLYLTEKIDADEFSEEDLKITRSLAAAASIAIDNAQLFEASAARERWLRTAADAVALVENEGWTPDIWHQVAGRVATGLHSDHLAFRAAKQDSTRVLTDAELCGIGFDPVHDTGLLLVIDAGGERLCAFELAWRDGKNTIRDPIVEQALSLAERVAGAWLLLRRRAQLEHLAVLEDRDRIARDLHDLVIQRLFATGLSVQSLHGQLPPEVQPRIDRVVDDLDETIKQIRRTIFELRTGPVALTLPAAATRLVHDSAPAMGHTASVTVTGDLAKVTDQLAAEVLAVLRECLANVARHAQATQTAVAIDIEPERLSVTVHDNGIGFSDPPRRSGLANLSERATERDGVFWVEGPPDGGTIVNWSVPLH